MFDNLANLGYGLVIFAIIIGVGSIVLYNFGGATADCGISSCGTAGIWNSTTDVCSNGTSANCGNPSGSSYTNLNYLLGNLGQGGLAGWTPAIIAISVGILFLGAFMARGGKRSKGRY